MARGQHRDNDWRCAGAYTDLRLVYISMVPLATMIQALARCWISAHCQRAPVTFGAKFNTGANFDLNVRWRRATGATPSTEGSLLLSVLARTSHFSQC
ncbi:hypothetical protein BZG77_04925 [Salinivibrio sp. IB643]|nr:hypothetical protein BZG77_04925 [Salinivibrio sp. IB643]